MRRTPGAPGSGRGPVAASRGGGGSGPRGWLRRRRALRTADRWGAPERPRAEFRLLGHLEVGDGDAAQAFGGPKQRALLAFLLLHAGEVVTTERLVDAIWGDEPPPTATAIVYGYVRKVRSALETTSATLSRDQPGTSSTSRAARWTWRSSSASAGSAGRRSGPATPPMLASCWARRSSCGAAKPSTVSTARVHPGRAVAPRVAPPGDDAGPDRRRAPARRRGRGRGRTRGARSRASSRRGHPRPAHGGAVSDGQPGRGARDLRGHPSGARGGARPRPVAHACRSSRARSSARTHRSTCRTGSRTSHRRGAHGRRHRPSASSSRGTSARSSASQRSASAMRRSSSGASASSPRWSLASPSTASSG